MKIVYKKGDEQSVKTKKLPMDKDPVFIANLRRQFIEDHNAKIKRAIDKGKNGLPLTKQEQIIYQLHLEKQKGGK